MKSIPHSRPTIGEAELESVAGTILSGNIAQGSLVDTFERAVADFIGVRSAVAVSSGSAALHLSLLALKVGKDDQVIIPDYTCTALLNVVRYVEASPRIADIIPGGYNLDPLDIKGRLTRDIKAIVLVHSFGLPADIKEIKSFGVPVIEDLAQAMGADYRGKPVGSFGELSIVSFYATKVMTTGEGGMVLSNSSDLLERVRDLRDYDEKKDYKVRYNYKMTDMQAAMGLVQLKRLPEFIEKRREIADYYNESLKEAPVCLPMSLEGRGHIYHRYIVEVERGLSSIIDSLKKRGVDAKMPIYKPLHRYLKKGSFKNSLNAWNRALSVPIYPSLTDEDRERVVEAVKEVL
ncbi:MAG: DegT/DnrJ/EryC1/StrS family aminotransferase [Thermodesulfobacteriota bacterium]